MTTHPAPTVAPCPFCGEADDLTVDDYEDGAKGPTMFWVRCQCGAETAAADSKDKAIAAWNRRTPASAPAAPAVGDDLMSLMDRADERVRSLIARAALTREAASEKGSEHE